jgi:hypothetical protein
LTLVKPPSHPRLGFRSSEAFTSALSLQCDDGFGPKVVVSGQP